MPFPIRNLVVRTVLPVLASSHLLMGDPAAARQGQSPAHLFAFTDVRLETTSLGDSMASARFNIINLGPEADELVEASSPDFESALLHASRAMPDAGRNRIAAATARIPSRGSLTVGSQGIKVLLIDPIRPLHPGARLTLTLQFRNSGHLTIDLPVPAGPQQAQVTRE